MEEIWARYNTLLDAVTELEIPSEKANRWMQVVNRNESLDLSEDETQLFESLLPDWHRNFLQHKHIPRYAIKTSLARLVRMEEDAKDLWNDAALLCMRNSPTTLKIIHFAMLAYPLIDLAIMRRQLCIGTIAEIRKGNLKPYFFPGSLENRGLNEREKLQEYKHLSFTDQVMASISIHELGNALCNNETFTKEAYKLWLGYYDKARSKLNKEKRQSTYDKNEERREIYKQVVSELGKTTQKGKLVEEAARRAGCKEKTMREALKAED
ncbi:hypothetical protein [Thiothrix nivea]|uniref:Uncharacterized protein n=1 Tax=Thiothrix nivea (strain ATCC 35100 / DSM 5205 / JP2) TaxID=870187 RepID=A0A656H9R4_THINJ|nr:hypothetical protein [Thiothrix nivea]EIJ33368.1 hypothetical protein Thini_0731 [Thiothrix nivea DSM 5205]